MTPPLAVTFDFWNTLFWPNDGVQRARARRLAPWLRASEEAVHSALVDGFARHSAEWRAGRCWGTRDLAQALLDRFPADGRHTCTDELAELIEISGVGVDERPVAGSLEVVERLRRAGVKLGIISDTGFSPGRVLRGFLSRAGLLHRFEPAALTFSDEVGVPKPNPRIFRAALEALAVEPSQAVHVGDLRATDVAGARAVGMRSVRFTGCYKDGSDGPEANAVISRLTDLPTVLGMP
jgi:HAD superfamily hydrolase (TIGR01549 family)